MVYSQAPIPFSRGSAKPRVVLHNIVGDILEPFPEDSRSVLVFDALRHQISGGASIEDVLESAASAAQDLTSASGAAIAMGKGASVLCVACHGETAPPLGAQLSVDSGISGECIRSGKSLICDDTQLDARIDSDLCLRLGLRSLAAVALSAPGERVGLLEVFSNYPANFSPEHVEILRRLGELVELTYARGSAKATGLEADPQGQAGAQVSTGTIDESLAEPRTIDWLRDSQEQPGERKFPFWAIPVALILILLCFRGWMLLHEPAQASGAPLPPAAETLDATLSPVEKPTPSRDIPRHRTPKSQPSDPQTAEAPEVVVRKFENGSNSAQASGTPPAESEDSNDPPPLPVASFNNAVLSDLVAKQATMPKAVMISPGVVRGTLTHRVPPTYPREALSQGLSGPVVLRATIDENGSVDQLKAVSGPPVLARAAMDAVREWRYQPSLLNGTPVRVETEITVNFKKP
jgi:protein TonB